MAYQKLLATHFSDPVHVIYGPKTPADQLKAFLCEICHGLESGRGEAGFDVARVNLVVKEWAGGAPVTIPVADLEALGFVPTGTQDAEQFISEHFQDWEPTA
jgi:hypothetical protein